MLIDCLRIGVLLLPAFGMTHSYANILAARSQTKDTNQTNWKFDFGPGKVAPGYQQILANSIYSKELGYGFEPGTKVTCPDRGGKDALRSDFCASDQPFYFSVALPEGNYQVTLTQGHREIERLDARAEVAP